LKPDTTIICVAKIAVALLGAGLSVFLYGWHAVHIFVPEDDPFVARKKQYTCWWVHQFCLNCICSLVGWGAAYFFIFYRLWCSVKPITFTASDAVIILLALLGMAGFLPLTLSLIPRALGSLVSLIKG